MDNWIKLNEEIIKPGLCTQCGSCVGLSNGKLIFKEKKGIPVPVKIKEDDINSECYDGCPARYCNYPDLNKFVFGELPSNWLCGVVKNSYISYSNDENIRRNSASGGVITRTLMYLLETKKVKGVICIQLGKNVPYKAEPVIIKKKEDLIKTAQSVYSVTPVNTILKILDKEEGPFAYVGLPDQVASIRKLQKLGHKGANKIKYILGPYTGTQMYFEAIRSFLRSNNVKSEEEITSLKYRAGEWPGYLEIKLKDGRVLRAEKFYYNYLIPFFITSSSLQVVDFTNELTDISVGDAWSPKYEGKGKGYSVVLSRTEQGDAILQEMSKKKLITLEDVNLDEALNMHGHMIDFKKRGSFIRNSWKKIRPDYGYSPEKIHFSRILVEIVISTIFKIGQLKISRWVVEQIPLGILGPIFNKIRLKWKGMSRTTKRKGLSDSKFVIHD